MRVSARPGGFLLSVVVLASLPMAAVAQETPTAGGVPSEEAQPTAAEELIQKGMELFDEDDYESGLVKFDEAVAGEPGNPAAYLVRYVTRVWLGDKGGAAADRKQALALAEQAKTQNPDYDVPKLVQAWVSRVEGEVEIRALNYPGAVPLLQKAIDLNRADPLTYAWLAEALMHQQMDRNWPAFRRTTEAQSAIDNAFAIASKRLAGQPDSEYWRWLAVKSLLLDAEHQEDWNQASRLLSQVANYIPNHPEVHVQRAQWHLLHNGDEMLGLAELATARDFAQAEIARQHKVMFHHYLLALAAYIEGWYRLGETRGRWPKKEELDASLPHFEEAARLSPQTAGFLLRSCEAMRYRHFAEKKREKSTVLVRRARDCAEKLSAVAPDSALSSIEQARVIVWEGYRLYFTERRKREALAKFNEAIAKYDEAIRAYPREPQLRLMKGWAQWYLGEYHGGRTMKASMREQARKSGAEAILLSRDPNYADTLFKEMAYVAEIQGAGWSGALAMAMAGMAGMATGNVAAANMAMIAEMQRQQAQLEAEVAAMKAAAGVPPGPLRQRSVLEDLSMVFLQIAQAMPEMQRQARAEIDATRQMVLDAQAEGQRRQAIEEEAKQKAIEEEQTKKEAEEEALIRQQQASSPQPSPRQQSQPQQQRGSIEDILGTWCLKGRSCSAANLQIARVLGGVEGRLTILFTQMNRTYTYRLKDIRLRAGTDSLFDFEVDCTGDPREVARAEGWKRSYLSYYYAMSEPEQIYYYGECHPLDDWQVWRRPGSN